MIRGGDTTLLRLLSSKPATASLEFAIITPVMGILLMAAVDLSEAIIKYHLLNSTVQQAGLMASQLSIRPDQSSSLTLAQVNEASSVIFAIFPGLASLPIYSPSNPNPPYAVTLSNILFTPTQTGCTGGLDCTSYTAAVSWSVPLQYGRQYFRACKTTTQVSATDNPVIVNGVPSTVPTSGVISALTYVLTVDVTYQYTPFFGRFIGPITMQQSGYFNPRSYSAGSTTLVGYPVSGCPTGPSS